MSFRIRPFAGAVSGLFLALGVLAAPAQAQEAAIKAGLAVSRLQTEGAIPFNSSFVGTSIGGHVRFMFGPVGLQPEIQMISRGGSVDAPESMEERIRIEYIEIPLLLVLPFRVGAFEPYAFAGPSAALESRCRSIVEEDGLKTNFGCDQSTGNVFDRRMFDYGINAGAGISHRLGAGRLLVEARHTWGMRNIYDGDVEGIEVRNRSFLMSIGYTITSRDPEN
jgi:hypothetical protein